MLTSDSKHPPRRVPQRCHFKALVFRMCLLRVRTPFSQRISPETASILQGHHGVRCGTPRRGLSTCEWSGVHEPAQACSSLRQSTPLQAALLVTGSSCPWNWAPCHPSSRGNYSILCSQVRAPHSCCPSQSSSPGVTHTNSVPPQSSLPGSHTPIVSLPSPAGQENHQTKHAHHST